MPSTILPKSLIVSHDNSVRTRIVVETPQELLCPEGMFVCQFDMGGGDVYRYFGMLTGRTRRVWGYDCPTVVLFQVDTVAREDGSIWGVPGLRVKGTLITLPQNVVEA